MDECLDRLRTLIGKDNVSSLEKKKVAIIGLGGVGGYVLDSLARTGISRFVLCDHDNFEKSNINRQLLSLSDNIGKRKVDVAKERVMSINPDAECTTYYEFFSEANAERILSETDMVIARRQGVVDDGEIRVFRGVAFPFERRVRILVRVNHIIDSAVQRFGSRQLFFLG